MIFFSTGSPGLSKIVTKFKVQGDPVEFSHPDNNYLYFNSGLPFPSVNNLNKLPFIYWPQALVQPL